jgi:hypothetical protein
MRGRGPERDILRGGSLPARRRAPEGLLAYCHRRVGVVGDEAVNAKLVVQRQLGWLVAAGVRGGEAPGAPPSWPDASAWQSALGARV